MPAVAGVLAVNVQNGREWQPRQVFGQGLQGGQIVAMRRGELHQIGQGMAAHGGGEVGADVGGGGVPVRQLAVWSADIFVGKFGVCVTGWPTKMSALHRVGQGIHAAGEKRLLGGLEAGDALNPVRGVGARPPVRTLQERGEQGARLVQVVLFYLQQTKALPGLSQHHAGAVVVLPLGVGDELGENGLGLAVAPVVGGVATDVQFRLRRPRAVGEVLGVLTEHFDGLGVFVTAHANG